MRLFLDSGNCFTIFYIYSYSCASHILMPEKQVAHWVFNMSLDSTFEWSRTILHVKSLLSNKVFRLSSDNKFIAQLVYAFIEHIQLYINNFEDIFLVEA